MAMMPMISCFVSNYQHANWDKRLFADPCFPKSHTDASFTLPLADRPFSSAYLPTLMFQLPTYVLCDSSTISSFAGNSKISRFPEMRNLSYWRLACGGPWSRSLIGSACMTSRHQMRLSDLPPGALRHWVIATDHAESTGLPPLYWYHCFWSIMFHFPINLCRVWWISIFIRY